MERSDNTFSSVFCQGGDCDSNTTLTNLADKSFIIPFTFQNFKNNSITYINLRVFAFISFIVFFCLPCLMIFHSLQMINKIIYIQRYK